MNFRRANLQVFTNLVLVVPKATSLPQIVREWLHKKEFQSNGKLWQIKKGLVITTILVYEYDDDWSLHNLNEYLPNTTEVHLLASSLPEAQPVTLISEYANAALMNWDPTCQLT